MSTPGLDRGDPSPRTPLVPPAPRTGVDGPARPAPARAGHDEVFRRQLARLGWGLSAPAFAVIAAVTIFPIVYSIIMSFNNVAVTGNGFSLDGFTIGNYNLLIHSVHWRDALYFTLYYTLATVVIMILAGPVSAAPLPNSEGDRA